MLYNLTICTYFHLRLKQRYIYPKVEISTTKLKPVTVAKWLAQQLWSPDRIWHRTSAETCLCQVRITLPTLALKPRGDVTRSPKQGYQ